MLPTALIISLLIACNETTDPEVTEAAAVETVSPESQRKEALKTLRIKIGNGSAQEVLETLQSDGSIPADQKKDMAFYAAGALGLALAFNPLMRTTSF